MAGPLDGQVAVVTGGGHGIGRACALELARAGATVVVGYASDQAAANACFMEIVNAGGNGLVVRADVSDAEQAELLIETATESFDRVDILVNTAGAPGPAGVDASDSSSDNERWDSVIQAELSSMFYCTAAVLPAMREQNYGRIINIASPAVSGGGDDAAGHAAATAGMVALTKSVAEQLAGTEITANAINPGAVEDSTTEALTPVRRNTVEDVATAVRFLCTEGGFFTGTHLSSGGAHVHR